MAAIKNILAKVCWVFLIPFIATSPLNEPRVINGTVAVADNTKHQVSIRDKIMDDSTFGDGHVCGGSLIAPNVVLTAAHCFYDDWIEDFFVYSNYVVVMGTLNRYEKTENTVSIDVAEIIYNGFKRPTFEKDIALLVLAESVPTSNPAIKVIPLNREPIPVGTVCQISGWGETEKGSLSDLLMTVDLPIIDSETCGTNYDENQILDGMICAGYMEGEKDACQGDSGGPLVSNGKLVGIVSYGDGCGSPGFPGVYTEVSHYVDWIDEQIANLSSTTVLPEGTDLPDIIDQETECQNNTLPDGSKCKGNSGNMKSLSSVVFILGSLLFYSF